eukprot:425496_1
MFTSRLELDLQIGQTVLDKNYHKENCHYYNKDANHDEIIMTMLNTFTSHHAETFDNFNLNVMQMEAITLATYEEHIQHKILDADTDITSGYIRTVTTKLRNWKGYHPTPAKDQPAAETAEISTFREYFQHCRSWFDHGKMELLAIHFWIPTIRAIEELSQRCATNIFGAQACPLQKIFMEYLATWILRGLFEGQIKPSNTRFVWLVPATVYSKFHNQSHHLGLHVNLQNNATTHTEIRKAYLQTVRHRINVLKASFEVELFAYYKTPNTLESRSSTRVCDVSSCRSTNPGDGHQSAVGFVDPRMINQNQKEMTNDPYDMMWRSPPPPPYVPCWIESPGSMMPSDEFDAMMSHNFDSNQDHAFQCQTQMYYT